jgi:haloalkane dehalogenase
VIPAELGYEKKRANVEGREMAYIEAGSGDPIVFLHGNPTSSYLWRNVIPHLEELGRCIAPDMIGMGNSQKLDDSGPDSYRFVEHRKYLYGLLEQLGVGENTVLVAHDWGGGFAFHWAQRNPDAVQGIAYMETIIQPLSWDDWPEAARGVFQGFRSPAGEGMVLEKNIFIEAVLPRSILRTLSDAEMDTYRAPYLEAGESRRPTLTWPRELPIDGEPDDVHQIVADYAHWLSKTDIPKLLVCGDPGSIMTGARLDFARSLKNQREVTVKGAHFIQEDSPDEIGAAVADFVKELRGG